MPESNLDERPVADRASFIDRHGLWSEWQHAAAAQMRRMVDELGIEMLRFSFVDEHGVLRGKTIARGRIWAALHSGVTAPSSLLLKDTSGKSVFSVFSAETGVGLAGFSGAGAIVMVPEPRTFKVLPWAPNTGWILCDLHFPDGLPVPLCTRSLLRKELTALASRGLSMTLGPELEFHVYPADPANRVDASVGSSGGTGAAGRISPTTRGPQLLHEEELDRVQPLIDALYRGLTALDLPLRTIELESGPSQFELTMEAGSASEMADAIVLCRSAVRRIAAGIGYHATFMARPQGIDGASSCWHLNQSLTDAAGDNAFMPDSPGASLSMLGASYLAGILEHAPAAAAFTTPTVNGYKRYRPHSFAPDRIAWGLDNRGAMVRAVGGFGDPATRLENRSGEPAANPYLYIASQLISGMDGVDRGLIPPAPTNEPYNAIAPPLPSSLGEAVEALAKDTAFRSALGDLVVDWFATIKRAEFARYLLHVSDWEQSEYFDTF